MAIVHPGPAHLDRRVLVPGRAEAVRWTLPAGATLLDALSAQLLASGAEAAAVVLDGLMLEGGDYVMPARSSDGAHAAWYSPARPIGAARLEHAVAMVGEKDGRPFVHCHALWPGPDGPRMGHLLNETVRIAAAAAVPAWLFHGGRFVVRADAETGFSLFRPEGAGEPGRAALLTVRPHEDLPTALAATGLEAARVFGLGSLIGAQFADAPPMADPISEMLVLPGARVGSALPVAVVDLAGVVHRGTVVAAPICVTGEFLLVG